MFTIIKLLTEFSIGVLTGAVAMAGVIILVMVVLFIIDLIRER